MNMKHGLVPGFAALFIAAIVSLSSIACAPEEDKENTDPKKITITGLTVSGNAQVVLFSGFNDSNQPTYEAVGAGAISGGSVTVSLKKQDQSDWTGTGSYHLMFTIGSNSYIYTDGKAMSTFTSYDQLPKISISDTTTTVAFGKFATGGSGD